MNKSFIPIITLLFVVQVFAGGRLGLDLSRASAYLNGGDCYVNPGVAYAAPVVTKYFGLPYGWNQHQEKIVIPNVVTQTGSWVVGLRLTDGSESYNEQVRFAVNGLSVTVSPFSLSTSRTLVIGTNFRSQGVSDDQYRGFVSNLPATPASTPSVRQVATTGGASPIPTFPGLQFGNANWANNLLRPAANTDFVNNVLIRQTPAFSQGSQVSEQERRKALQRQYSANQALNQLNSLINTLSSNVATTGSSISRLQSAVDDARSTNSKCTNQILDLSGTKASTETALNDLNSQVSSAQSRLNDYNSALAALVQRKNQLTQQRSAIEVKRVPESSISSLQQRYSSCSNQANAIRNEYSGIVSNIQRNSDQIITLRNSAADAPRQISLVDQQIRNVDNTIADLENQLRNARSRRATLDSERARYSDLVQSANNQIARLQGENNGLRTQASGIQSRVDQQLVQCNSFKRQADTIRSNIASNQGDYENVNRQIQVQEGLISSKQNEINRLNSQISGYPIRKSPLQASLANTQSALDRQYSICGQSSGALTNAQNELQAANLKLETENRFLSEAKTKLPAAQAQKDAADAEVNRILNSVSTSSPSSTTIRVNTDSGVGSTSITVGNFGTPVTVNIVDYMTRNYGTSNSRYWQPYVRVGSPVTVMYPVSQTTWSALRGSSSGGVFLPRSGRLSASGLGAFSCGGGAVTSGYGRITSVQPGYLTVQGPSREVYNLRVGSCSRLEANRPQYVASVYDNVFFRGVRNGGDYEVHDLTCMN